MAQRFQPGIELVDQGYAVGYVQANDIVVGDAVQVLHQRPDRVPVCRHHQSLPSLDGWCHGFVPKRQHAFHGIFETLGKRNLPCLKPCIPDVGAFAARIIQAQRWRWRVVASAPDQHLRIAVLFGHVRLVQALKRPVVALIQAPAMDYRQPGPVHLVKAMPQRTGCPLEHAGVGQIKLVGVLAQQPTSSFCLLDTGAGQVHIGPAGKTVLQIPGRFAVADQDEFVHGFHGGRCRRVCRHHRRPGFVTAAGVKIRPPCGIQKHHSKMRWLAPPAVAAHQQGTT